MIIFLPIIWWKRLQKTFLSAKPAEFYLRGITKLPDEWLVGIQNNGQYAIDWNLSIVKLFNNMHYILLKQ